MKVYVCAYACWCEEIIKKQIKANEQITSIQKYLFKAGNFVAFLFLF